MNWLTERAGPDELTDTDFDATGPLPPAPAQHPGRRAAEGKHRAPSAAALPLNPAPYDNASPHAHAELPEDRRAQLCLHHPNKPHGTRPSDPSCAPRPPDQPRNDEIPPIKVIGRDFVNRLRANP
ncbi:hypothetical protein [Streptomyces sp. NPDC058280]|uniref:hypothetical protein n=1 Tax=Streptomyces sp. NPDC058280 TaxID=3346419 RepID=UPI0036EAAE25